MPGVVRLEFVDGPQQGRKLEIVPRQALVVGRHSTCRLRLLGDGLISRHHCLLEADPPRLRVRDLGSLNGTFVNGRRLGGGAIADGRTDPRLRECELKHGDRLAIGATTFAVYIETGIHCAECRRELDPIELAHAIRLGEAYACDVCAAQWTAEYRPTLQIVTTNCALCGGAITASVAEAEEPICAVCRERAVAGASDLRRFVELRSTGDAKGEGLSRYRLGRELGRGRQSTVYHGVRRSDAADVAIKILPISATLDQPTRDRFRREIDVLAKLEHPQIVRLLDSGLTDGFSFLVTEYCNAGNLESFTVRHGGRLPPSLAAALMEPCFAAVEFAHCRGIVHRDLKPRNILLDERDGRLTPKIADFGFAKAYENAGLSGLTLTGDAAGTPFFMPREQLTDYKHAGPASDVWSLAATYYYLLSGTTPLDFSETRDPLEVILMDEPTPILQRCPELPRATADAIDAALSTKVASRPQSIAQFYTKMTGKLLVY